MWRRAATPGAAACLGAVERFEDRAQSDRRRHPDLARRRRGQVEVHAVARAVHGRSPGRSRSGRRGRPPPSTRTAAAGARRRACGAAASGRTRSCCRTARARSSVAVRTRQDPRQRADRRRSHDAVARQAAALLERFDRHLGLTAEHAVGAADRVALHRQHPLERDDVVALVALLERALTERARADARRREREHRTRQREDGETANRMTTGSPRTALSPSRGGGRRARAWPAATATRARRAPPHPPRSGSPAASRSPRRASRPPPRPMRCRPPARSPAR